jgi:hypothetical protein
MVRNYSPKLLLELGRNSNFDELVIASYGCKLSWRWTDVAWMAAVLLRDYRGDESMIDDLRYYGGMYLYSLGGGWLHDRSSLALICYNNILYIRNSNKFKNKFVT